MTKTIYHVLYYRETEAEKTVTRVHKTAIFENLDDLTDWLESENRIGYIVRIYDIQREEVEI